MDRAITASEANQHFSEMLRAVAQGESFIVMSRGRPVARVTPVDAADQAHALRELIDYLASQPRRRLGDWRRDDLYA
jgi:prevent-host-death family protein